MKTLQLQKRKQYNNNHMTCQVVSMVCHDLHDASNNHAIIYRPNSHDYVVVNGLHLFDDNTCCWNFAYAYDISNLTDATTLLLSKVQ